MTKEEFSILVKAMKAVYPQPTFLPDKYAIELWYSLLSDLPYKQLNIAVQMHMMSEIHPPTIAGLREKSANVVNTEDYMSELQAWSLVRKAIRNSNYHADEEFEKLPESCKRAVGSPANLREWASMNEHEVETVEQSQFLRSYRSVLELMSSESKLSPMLLDKIKDAKVQIGTTEKLLIE